MMDVATYRALRAAGMTEDRAQAIAEAVAERDRRFAGVERGLACLKWMTALQLGLVLLMSLALFWTP